MRVSVSVQIKLTPVDEAAPALGEEAEHDPLKKPLALDDGKMAVISW